MLHHACILGGPQQREQNQNSKPTPGVTMMHRATKRGFPPMHSGRQNQKWPTCGQSGYVTPAVSGIPTASELGGRITIGPLVGKVAT